MFISEFIVLFMSKLCDLQPTESTKGSAIEAYNKTLAKHHTWLIRNAARLAMNFLPSQKTLYHQVNCLLCSLLIISIIIIFII